VALEVFQQALRVAMAEVVQVEALRLTGLMEL
jgi:hypothetical protein